MKKGGAREDSVFPSRKKAGKALLYSRGEDIRHFGSLTVAEGRADAHTDYSGVEIPSEDCCFRSGRCHYGHNKLSAQEREKEMRVHYDDKVDALYIKLGNQKPEGVVEIADGVNLDTTSDDKIVGIEILHASKKMNIKTILSYELQLDAKLIKKIA
jgi:uncharacterized protein YuzE